MVLEYFSLRKSKGKQSKDTAEAEGDKSPVIPTTNNSSRKSPPRAPRPRAERSLPSSSTMARKFEAETRNLR